MLDFFGCLVFQTLDFFGSLGFGMLGFLSFFCFRTSFFVFWPLGFFGPFFFGCHSLTNSPFISCVFHSSRCFFTRLAFFSCFSTSLRLATRFRLWREVSKNFVSSILQKTYRSNFCTHHNYTVQNSASFHFNRSFWNNPFSWVSFLGRFLLLPNAWFLWLLSFSNAWFLWLLRLWNAWFLKLLLFPNVFFCLLATWLLWPLLLWLPFFDQLSVHLLRFPLFALLFHPSCFFQLFLHIVKTGNPLPLMARGLQLVFLVDLQSSPKSWEESIPTYCLRLGKRYCRLTPSREDESRPLNFDLYNFYHFIIMFLFIFPVVTFLMKNFILFIVHPIRFKT